MTKMQFEYWANNLSDWEYNEQRDAYYMNQIYRIRGFNDKALKFQVFNTKSKKWKTICRCKLSRLTILPTNDLRTSDGHIIACKSTPYRKDHSVLGEIHL